MPSFNIVKKSSIPDSFRVQSIKGQFDLKLKDEVSERFVGSIPIEKREWNIGVIYGASGTGKSTIARYLWKSHIRKYDFGDLPVIDEMPKSKNTEEITKAFNSVGFATVWSWLKPYRVLSTGEKMRVNLARAILEDNELIVFDEFTSVVNREVAKAGSLAIQKAIRKLDKKFIAVTCHNDIIEWLSPDWVFCTDNMKFEYTRGSLRRPEIKISIYKLEDKSWWNLFKKYHYLNTELNNAAQCYIGLYDDLEPCVFYAVLHFPHSRVRNFKRGHRLVVMPDYQGCGIGHEFSSQIAQLYLDKGFRFLATNSNHSLLWQRARDKRWKISNKTRRAPHQGEGYRNSQASLSASSTLKLTYSFEYIGSK